MSEENGPAFKDGQNDELEKLIKDYVEKESDDIEGMVEKVLLAVCLTAVSHPENGETFVEGEAFSFEPIIDHEEVPYYALYTSRDQADKMEAEMVLPADAAFMFEEAEVDGFGVCVNPGDEFSLVFPPELVKEIVDVYLTEEE
ncbi:MAG: SseB family protein [Pseudobdellovibrionaceae bacterium]|jgi:hypothetical protein|nr:SseB family protein [Pseudobdellovibrionaceae bacterium]